MKSFLETYGIAIFTLIVVGIMIQLAPTMGVMVEDEIITKIGKISGIKIPGIPGSGDDGSGGEEVTLLDGQSFNALVPFSTTSIEFLYTAAPESATIDVSEAKDGSILAWSEDTTFKIAPKNAGDVICANPDSRDMFLGSSWEMGESCACVQNIKFLNFNTSKVINMENMFQGTGYTQESFEMNISDWDVSNVTNMYSMFCLTGQKATNWSIGDLSNWDVSNVTDMGNMFNNASYSISTLNLKGLNEWDISSVTNMDSMFREFGYKSTEFNLDLSGWEPLNVISMNSMFSGAGQNSKNFNLNLSNWKTENVTNMRSMFNNAGKNSTTFNITGIENWNTNKVTDMAYMFNNAGKNASYSLDFFSWNVSKVTSYADFNYGVTSKVTPPRWN